MDKVEVIETMHLNGGPIVGLSEESAARRGHRLEEVEGKSPRGFKLYRIKDAEMQFKVGEVLYCDPPKDVYHKLVLDNGETLTERYLRLKDERIRAAAQAEAQAEAAQAEAARAEA